MSQQTARFAALNAAELEAMLQHQRDAQHKGFSVADLWQTFDSLIHPGADWKGEIVAVVRTVDMPRVIAAVEFFSGSRTLQHISYWGMSVEQRSEFINRRDLNGEVDCIAIYSPGYRASGC
jgi:hypothetical protein